MDDDELSADDLTSGGADLDTGSGPSAGFSAWFEQHQRAVLIIGVLTLGLTVWLFVRKPTSSSGTTAGVAQSGPAQPGMTSDTASALNAQDTLLEQLAQAVQQLQQQAQPTGNPGPLPNPTSNGTWSAALLTWLAGLHLTGQQQQGLLSIWQATPANQQQAFLNLPLDQEEAYINQYLAMQGSQADANAPIVPYNRVNLPITVYSTPPTYGRTPPGA